MLAVLLLQWGTLDFHRLSLRNLNEAMRKTRKLCAVMLDTTGREIMVMREHEIDEKGWPEHVNNMEVKEGQKVHVAVSVSPCLQVLHAMPCRVPQTSLSSHQCPATVRQVSTQ